MALDVVLEQGPSVPEHPTLWLPASGSTMHGGLKPSNFTKRFSDAGRVCVSSNKGYKGYKGKRPQSR
eukprot:791575-Pelagomonas_calceolata.AAC.1